MTQQPSCLLHVVAVLDHLRRGGVPEAVEARQDATLNRNRLPVLLALAGIASAQSAKSRAVAVVKEAVGERYVQFEVGPPSYLNVSGAHISVTCSQLSGSKFKCLWSAGNRLKESATGGATVTLYFNGQRSAQSWIAPLSIRSVSS